jgi:four helix bundle protein
MQDFKKTFVWKKAFELDGNIYKITRNFPKEELYGLTSQLKRASVSICSNIAEGCGKNTDKDFARFLHNSFGSLKEVECQLLIAERENFISTETLTKMQVQINELTIMLISFIKKLIS